jgi:hypothetical protein
LHFSTIRNQQHDQDNSTIENQQYNQDDASRNKPGHLKGYTAMARLYLKEKRKKAIDLVTTKYSELKTAHRGNLPVGSFLKICDETLKELSLHDENIHIKHRPILSPL